MSRTQEQRLQECIHIARKINELGIPFDCPGRRELKTIFENWIRTGEAYAGKVSFKEWNRYADIVLPSSRKQVIFILRIYK